MDRNFARCFCEIVAPGLMLLMAAGAPAQVGNPPAAPGTAPAADACKRDVLKYQAHIEFVRKSLGNQEADALAAQFMSRADWDALLLKEGYCGLSTRLRARKLV